MTIDEFRIKFPSPCGDYGSYPEILHYDRRLHLQSFRPLAGIMVLIAIRKHGAYMTPEKVSVPLRGLWFLSRNGCHKRQYRTAVSVPLRGLWFLSPSSM